MRKPVTMESFEELSRMLQKHHQAISQVFWNYERGLISFNEALEQLGRIQSAMIEDLKVLKETINDSFPDPTK